MEANGTGGMMTAEQISKLGEILADDSAGTFVALDVRNADEDAITVTVDEVDDEGQHRQMVLEVQTDGTVSDAYENH